MFVKTMCTRLVVTESDLQCCNGGGQLGKMFPPALQSYLENDSYY